MLVFEVLVARNYRVIILPCGRKVYSLRWSQVDYESHTHVECT